MTVIENLNPRVQYNGPIAINDALSINFPYTNTEDVKCVADNKQLVYNQDYTVLEQTLTIKIAIPKGQTITIYRSTPLDQQAEFPQNNKFNSEKMNEALDKICMQQQEQVEESRRSVRVPISVINFDGQLPIPIPGRSLKINEDGTSFVLTEYDSDKAYSTTEQFKKEAQQARDEATTQAGIATTQAGIATTQANKAATSAAQAENTLNSATDVIEQEEQKAINNILAQQQTSINTIEQKGLDVVQTIERKQDNAVALLQNTADSNIEVMNNIKTETAQFLNFAEQEAEKSANSAQQANTAKQETQSILETATNTIDAEEAAALNAIASNRSKALTDIQTNQQSAITAIGNSKNAAVNAVVTQQNTSVNTVSAQQTTSVKAVQNQEANSTASVQNQEAIAISNVKASGQSYINKCKDWATSDNIVEDGLRSAKYYAEHAQSISGITYEQLRSSNAYENNGALLTDEEGYADILKMKHDNFDKEKFTVVGSPTITEYGVASFPLADDYVDMQLSSNVNSTWKIKAKFTTGTALDAIRTIFLNYLPGVLNNRIEVFLNHNRLAASIQISNGNYIATTATGSINAITNTTYWVSLSFNGEKYTFEYSTDGITWKQIWNISSTDKVLQQKIRIGNTAALDRQFNGSIDLSKFSITVDGKEVFTGVKTGIDNVEGIEIPYTISKTGAKIVSAEYRNKLIELYEKTGQANYYTLDTGEVPSFTLPMGNIYGLIRQNSDTLATKVNEDEMVEIDFADAGSYIAGCAMPSNKYVDLTLGANGTEYTAPANGWFQFFGTINTGYMHFINHANGFQSDYIRNQGSGAMTGCCKIAAKKGDVVAINYNSSITTTNFRFIYSVGSESEA